MKLIRYYNIGVNNDINLGIFLETLFTYRRYLRNRQTFINNVFQDVITSFNIKDRNGNQFIFDKSTVSRLFNNKIDLQIVFKDSISKLSEKQKKCLSDTLNEEIRKLIGEANLENFAKRIFIKCQASRSFDDKLIKKWKEMIDKDMIKSFFFEVFLTLCIQPNTLANKESFKRHIDNKESYFFLSEEEKKTQSKEFIKYVLSSRSKLNVDDFKYFCDVIEYSDIHINDEEKQRICFNFLKCLDKKEGCPPIELKFLFECAFDNYPENREPFIGWNEIIDKACIKYEINKLEKLKSKSEKSKDYGLFNDEIFSLTRSQRYYLELEDFLVQFANKNYMLPDFYGHINYDLWSACHCIASLVGQTKIANQFCEYLKRKIECNPNNRTIRDRCEGLIDKCHKYQSNNQ